MGGFKETRGKPSGKDTPRAVLDKRAVRKRRCKSRMAPSNDGLSPGDDYGDRPLLDELYPQRKQVFQPKRKCKGVNNEVNVSRFSFLDNPKGTLRTLRQIIHANATGEQVTINFTDRLCDDIAPYVVLGLMGRQLDSERPAGGRISSPVQRILEETGFLEHFDMKPTKASDTSFDVWPIKMTRCRQSSPDTQKGLNSAHAQVADEFTRKLENWMAKVGLGITDDGIEKLMTMMGEILNNAMLHSRDDSSGEAWISGFMVVHDIVDGEPEYLCHISIVNFGKSIFQSMQGCSYKLRSAIQGLIKKHSSYFRVRPYWNDEALWTLYALQDGVTRLDNEGDPKGGKGLMDAIEFFSAVGRTNNDKRQPKMALISGKVGLIIENPVIGYDEDGMRKIALNPENDLYKPPVKESIVILNQGFPGTILSWKFYLNKAYLKRLIADGRKHSDH